MTSHHSDIMILGAGVVGLAAALLAAQAGFSVCVIDKNQAPLPIDDLPIQARTIAINETNMALLDDLDVWPWLVRKRLGLINQMTIVDLNHDTLSLGNKNSGTLATVMEYAHLQWALYQACLHNNGIDMHFQSIAERVTTLEDAVILSLENHATFRAALIIGADGAQSWLCSHAGFDSEKRPYHHSACIGLASSEQSHHDTALQTFSRNAIVGVLPLNDVHQHSVIYSCTEEEKTRLLESNAVMQDCILTNATGHRLGMMHWQTPIKVIPLIEQHLQSYVKPHMAIIGDAAHRIHPMAGQGANLGLADAVALIAVLKKAKAENRPIGALRVLKMYEQQRQPKNAMMLTLHHILKESFSDHAALVTQCRAFSLKALDKMPWVKNIFRQVVN